MSEPRQFSDDISALWGPADDSILDPAPPPPDRIRPPAPEPPRADDAGLKAVEEQLQETLSRLAEEMAAHRAAIEADVRTQLAVVRSESTARVDDGLARMDAHLQERLAELGRQVATALSKAGITRPAGPEADRVDDVERQLHEGFTRLHRTIEGFRTGSVSRAELELLRSELKASVSEQVAGLASAPAAAEDSHMDALRAELIVRVEELEQRVKDELADAAQSVEVAQAGLVKRSELQTLWAGLKATLTKALTDVGGQAVAAADANLRTATAQLDRRLDRIEQAMAALAARIDDIESGRRPPGSS